MEKHTVVDYIKLVTRLYVDGNISNNNDLMVFFALC